MTNLLNKETLSIDMGEEIKRREVNIGWDTSELKRAFSMIGKEARKMYQKEHQVRVS